MNTANAYRAGGAGVLLLVLTGCGNYTITFEVAEIINAPAGDLSREELDVDILCFTAEDSERFPEIVDGTMRSDEWFRLRDADDSKITKIDPKRIFALRRGDANERRDTLAGTALVSLVDSQSGDPKTLVKFHHPSFMNKASAIVIYGRFRGQDGMAKEPPVVIQPPPKWLDRNDIVISIGPKTMRCSNCPN